jgi:hypothetical protein
MAIAIHKFPAAHLNGKDRRRCSRGSRHAHNTLNRPLSRDYIIAVVGGGGSGVATQSGRHRCQFDRAKCSAVLLGRLREEECVVSKWMLHRRTPSSTLHAITIAQA